MLSAMHTLIAEGTRVPVRGGGGRKEGGGGGGGGHGLSRLLAQKIESVPSCNIPSSKCLPCRTGSSMCIQMITASNNVSMSML